MAKITVAIIGGGISGIAQAIALQNALGDQVSLKIYEKSYAPGGVWRDAQWIGASVDVPIALYSLWSDPIQWKSYYASQPEVLAYWQSLIIKHDLTDRISVNTEVLSAEWQDHQKEYTLTLRREGTTVQESANIIISANGPLSKPRIPNIEGLDAYQGRYFHNLHWDKSVELEGKRIAVVGSGSSGVQIVPGLAELPGVHLTHIIRSGGYFYPKVNYQYSTLTNLVFRYVPYAQKLHRYLLFKESNDRWRAKVATPDHPTPDEVTLLKYLKDTAPAEYLDALTPDYPLGCKRLAFDAGWLASLHRPNVDLVKSGSLKATPAGLVTEDGVERPFDVIIFATGSDVANHGVGFRYVKGPKGDLADAWKGGPKAYAGTAVPGFPNYFTILGPNAIAGSWGFTIGVKTSFNALIISSMLKHGITSLEPKHEAFEKHNEQVHRELAKTNMASALCTNWWRDGKDGLISVPNSVSGLDMAKACRSIKWDDWIATRNEQVVDVSKAESQERGRRLALTSLAVGIVGVGLSLGHRLDWRL